MIGKLWFFLLAKVRVFALVAVILVGAGTVRIIDAYVPEFGPATDAFIARIALFLASLPSIEPLADQNDIETGTTLAERLIGLFSFRADGSSDDDRLLTGSTAEAADASSAPSADPDGVPEKNDAALPRSPTEELILKKLSERREALDKREEELNNREALLKASELRISERIKELKVLEADLKAKIDSRNEQLLSLKPLVTMYEAMKPKDAAQVFENLEYATLVELVAAMNPRKVSDVVAVMEPKLASRVTKDLATRGKASATVPDNSAAIMDKATELPDLTKAN